MMADDEPEPVQRKTSEKDTLGIVMVILGIILFAVAIASWIIWIPILSNSFYGEIGGVLLIVFGYLRLKD